jgi:hypothetical protein
MPQDKKEKKTTGSKASKRRSKSPKRGKSPKRDKSPGGRSKSKGGKKGAGVQDISSFRSEDRFTTTITADNILDVLPQEYQLLSREAGSGTGVDPLLYYLPKQATGTSANKFPNFR